MNCIVTSINDAYATPLIALNEIGILPTAYFASYYKGYADYHNPGIITEKYINWRFPEIMICKHIRSPTDLLIYNVPRTTTCQYDEVMVPKPILYNRKILQAINLIKPKYYLIICHIRAGIKQKNEIRNIINPRYEIQLDAASLTPIHYQRICWSNFPIDHIVDTNKMILQDFIESGTVDRNISLTISSAYHKGISSRRYYHYRQRQIVFENNKKCLTDDINRQNLGTNPYTQDMIKQKIRKLYPAEIEKLMQLPKDHLKAQTITESYVLAANCHHIGILKHIFQQLPLKK